MIGAASVWQGHNSTHTVVAILVFAGVLQLGYLCGAMLVRARATVYRGKATPPLDSRGFG
ncbi:hypothetical protein [Bradyrhizobium sp. McL0616]|uniref:hypothetical protein n=1 Tax=Bradyrhizobium sp. McL0616 TaxID=3415674 RepID=UPI003CF2CFD0